MRQTTEASEQEVLRRAQGTKTLPGLPDGLSGNGRIVLALRLIWERRSFVFRATVAGLILGGIVAFFVIPQEYRTTVLLMPPDSAQVSSGLAMAAALSRAGGGNLPGAMGDLLGLRSNGALFVGILHSRTVEDRLIDRFSLRRVYNVRYWETARKILEENTVISEDRKSGIIGLSVTDKNPQRAAALGQAYVEELDRLVAQVSTSAARREREFIEQRLKAVKQDLDGAAKDFSDFASQNMTLDIKDQGRAMLEAAATVDGHLIAAEAELRMLEEIYTDQNVRVRSARARVTELRAQLEKLGGAGKSAQSSASLSADADATPYPPIKRLAQLSSTYADLYRRLKIQEAVYEALSQQDEIAKVQEAKEIPSVKVLDPAAVPERKFFPPRLQIMVISSFLAFGCASTWVLGRARWHERNPQDPAVMLTEEVFAAVWYGLQRISLNGYGWRSIADKMRRLSRSRES